MWYFFRYYVINYPIYKICFKLYLHGDQKYLIYFKISQIYSFIPPLLKIYYQAVAYVAILSDYGANLVDGLASFLFFRYLGRAPIDEGIL